MRTISVLRAAALSLALVAPALSVGYAKEGGADAADRLQHPAIEAQLLQNAINAQRAELQAQQSSHEVALGKSPTATDAGALLSAPQANPFRSGPDRL